MLSFQGIDAIVQEQAAYVSLENVSYTIAKITEQRKYMRISSLASLMLLVWIINEFIVHSYK